MLRELSAPRRVLPHKRGARRTRSDLLGAVHQAGESAAVVVDSATRLNGTPRQSHNPSTNQEVIAIEAAA
jgi:hypothetical protein